MSRSGSEVNLQTCDAPEYPVATHRSSTKPLRIAGESPIHDRLVLLRIHEDFLTK
jgi:hypothetical protein